MVLISFLVLESAQRGRGLGDDSFDRVRCSSIVEDVDLGTYEPNTFGEAQDFRKKCLSSQSSSAPWWLSAISLT